MKNTIKNAKKSVLIIILLATITGFSKNTNGSIKKAMKDNYEITPYKELIKTDEFIIKGLI